MKPVRLLMVLGFALAIVATPVAIGKAQDATPEGTPGPACVAPELPAGAPTDPSASPVADDGMEMEAEEAAPVREGPASRNIGAEAEAALQNLVACLNSADWTGAAALMSPHMVNSVTGSNNPYDVVTMFESEPPAPLELVDVRDPVIDANNRIGLSIVFGGLFSGPGIQIAEKWYFVRDGDMLKLDEIVSSTLPVDLYPDATIVNIQMVDYAFALDMNTVPAGPVIFHLTNTSYNNEPHVGVFVTLTEGITTEEIITGDALPEDQMTGFLNAIFLEPGQVGEFYVEDLAPGVYTLACDVATANGVEHWMLGMVAQFTVE